CMARMVVRSCAVSIVLALAGGVVRAQTRQPATASGAYSAVALQQNSRITSLLEQLADQAGSLNNLTFAVRAQSQAASLLWTRDPDRARVIYRRAFESLEPTV